MLVNADFSARALVHGARSPWLPSPQDGVHRRMLDRIGDEVARATSIVRYLPGSAFSPHVHGGGEEFLVLEGVFQDELGAYPAGTYVRNPPTSRHTPRSDDGCIIFVKLHQFAPNDRTLVRIDTSKMESVSDHEQAGIAWVPLFADVGERVRIMTAAPHTTVELGDAGGTELLVLSGELHLDAERLEFQSWLRLPPHDRARVRAGAEGARFWSKTGHLAALTIPTAARS
jgi:anti-sigma factor ChrR (cupin superfamily)